jgi:hypothetical protein
VEENFSDAVTSHRFIGAIAHAGATK